MARDKKKKSQAADRRRPIKKKTSILSSESIEWVDYKDVNLLRRFMSERAKIRARRVTGNNAQQQRAVARAIRIAREMALLPYSVRQVTQRSRGGRRDRDRDRDRMPEAPPEREAPTAAVGEGDGGAPRPPDGANGAEAISEVAADASAPAPSGAEDES
jgi:small subunit ribosomal protein S18